MSFVSGKYNGVIETPTGAAATTLRILDWSWEEKVEELLTTHSLSNGVADRLAGVLDGEGSVNANVWSLALPASYGLYAGNTGMISKTLVPTNYGGVEKKFTIPHLIGQVAYKSAVGALASYDFKVSLASSVGTYTRAS